MQVGAWAACLRWVSAGSVRGRGGGFAADGAAVIGDVLGSGAAGCGRYRVIAEGAGRRAETFLRVVPAAGPVTALRAVLMMVPGEPTWDQPSLAAASDPGNRRGDNPLDRLVPAGDADQGGLVDDSAGSTNARLTVLVANLAGRGINLGLALMYNSLLWNRVGDRMVFVPRSTTTGRPLVGIWGSAKLSGPS